MNADQNEFLEVVTECAHLVLQALPSVLPENMRLQAQGVLRGDWAFSWGGVRAYAHTFVSRMHEKDQLVHPSATKFMMLGVA